MENLITKFNKAYTPTSFGERNSSTFHREEFEGYYIIECRGEIQGYLHHYSAWFSDLITPKIGKLLLDNVEKYHTDNGDESNYFHHSNLKNFREFLIRYSDGEFKVAKERCSNRGAAPKPKYFNELEKRYQNNITKMIDVITSVIG